MQDRCRELESRFPQDLFNWHELVGIFTCPLCSRVVNDVALFQCCKGHVICAQCVPRSQRCCPRCRQRMTVTRNLWMENAARFLFPSNQLISDMSLQLNGNSNGHQPHLPACPASPPVPRSRTQQKQHDASHSRRLVNYVSLLRLFECPSCRDWISAPISQCRKGHVICPACRAKGGKSCPCCKQSCTDVPNLMMEQAAGLIAFPCRFQSHGCSEFVRMSAKAGHEAFCQFRPVPCQYSSRGCSQVMQYHLMEQHVQHCAYRVLKIQQR